MLYRLRPWADTLETLRDPLFHSLQGLAPSPDGKLLYLSVGQADDPAYAVRVDEAIASAGFEARRVSNISNDDLRQIYGNADAFCLVGQNVDDGTVEGFGLAYLEAGSQGLPCIASPVQAVAELILDGENGLLVPPTDVGAIAGAVRRLMDDNALRSRLAATSRTRAASFSWARCAANSYSVPYDER